ncbi:hypothetical protein CRG98_004832 [Punica granatum]|uniref:Uncharacterized protein n=1 Tax=Punica granatum TaxID=22663 RepID=A0A2I0L279_PUNGR|nr:hypothetical protein CRG98_004832 [Punica granatum]
MASYRLEDDLGYSPVNEVRRVWEQEGAEDQKQEPVTRVALVGCRRRCQCTEKRPIREPCDPDAVIPPLMKLLVDILGGPQEDPIHRSFREHNHVSDDAWNEGAIHWAESPPNVHDLLPRRCDCFEPETGSWAVHPYLNGGDVDLTSLGSNQCNVLSRFLKIMRAVRKDKL